jgi:hypothetical protein
LFGDLKACLAARYGSLLRRQFRVESGAREEIAWNYDTTD